MLWLIGKKHKTACILFRPPVMFLFSGDVDISSNHLLRVCKIVVKSCYFHPAKSRMIKKQCLLLVYNFWGGGGHPHHAESILKTLILRLMQHILRRGFGSGHACVCVCYKNLCSSFSVLLFLLLLGLLWAKMWPLAHKLLSSGKIVFVKGCYKAKYWINNYINLFILYEKLFPSLKFIFWNGWGVKELVCMCLDFLLIYNIYNSIVLLNECRFKITKTTYNVSS